MDPALQEILNDYASDFHQLEAIIRLREEKQYPEKIRVVSEFKDIITCRLLKRDVMEVYNSKEVVSMKAPKSVGEKSIWDSEIDQTDREQNRYNTTNSVSGMGVVFGIIDWGADFAHPNFIDKEKGSRFICIWDQAHDQGVAPYGYGKVHGQEQINDALKTKRPYETLGYHPGRGDPMRIGSHGTCVADIAVGNGRLGRKGFAPNAEIIFVHLSSKGANRLQNLGDSVRILEALDFIGKVAGNRKLVINMSLGRMGGPKDGISPVEQGMDRFLEMRKNRIIVQSGGNYYNAKTHHSGIVRPGGKSVFTFYSDKGDTTTDEVEIWYSGKDNFELLLHHPKLDRSFRCRIDERVDIIHNKKLIGRLYSRTAEPNNGNNNINLFLYKNAPSGNWQVELRAKKALDGRYHAWIERDSSCKSCQSKFHSRYVNKDFTTGTICNGFNTVVVGAYDSAASGLTIAPFSSKGPTSDGRFKPDLVAPGVQIAGAKSTPRNQQKPMPGLTRMSGTSMATPHVSGSVAAMLELVPIDLSAYEIKSLVLQSTVNNFNRAADSDRMRIGAGIFRHEKLILNAKQYTGRKLSSLLLGKAE